MKKLTLNKINFVGATELTREQLKKVMGGDGYGTTEGGGGGGTMPGTENVCDNWTNKEFSICYNCCLAYEETQPKPIDPNYSSQVFCDNLCTR